ncbi:MAG: GNAT family N-acetyltransferase [Oscillospiraceae bacterium]
MILRPWREEDAESLYKYACDERVGPAAGWPVHTSVENSREIIKTILSEEGTLAVTLKELGDEPVGSVGIFPSEAGPIKGEPEIGYWIGVPFWGRGLIPEAVRELQRYVFEETGNSRCWCAHFVGNDKSRRVIEKCGFTYRFTDTADMRQLNESRPSCFYSITKEEWLWKAT